MPEMQMNEAPGVSAVACPAGAPDESYDALGCECANPMLQIERWGLEAGPAGVEPS